MLKKYGSLAALCVVLASCGGGGGDGGNTQGQQDPPPTIAPPAQVVPTPSYADAHRLEAFQRTNEIRKNLGLGLFAQNEKVDIAAQAHAKYLAQNGGSHTEDPSKPGFTGVRSSDRVEAAGYSASAGSEVLTYAPGTGADQVDVLMNTLYHRLPFVAYDLVHVGVGSAVSMNDRANYVSVLVFTRPLGSLGQEAPTVPYVVWPMRNSVISRGTTENENPPPPGAGYPITINFDPRKVISVSKFEIRENGTSVLPASVLTAENDPFSLIPRSTVALSPRDPLKAATGFAVLWEGTVDGVPLSVTWGFSTK